MNRLKRIFALAGALLLACMYIATLVFALMDSPSASGLFQASVAAKILVPVLLYGYILVARLLGSRHDDNISADGTSQAGTDESSSGRE